MATLKISDLSVGDWVKFRGNICDIYSIYQAVREIPGKVVLLSKNDYLGVAPVSELSPIPITAEILGKNGWWPRGLYCVWNIEDNQGTSHDGEYVVTWYADDEYLTISWGGREDEFLVERTLIECRVKYIHQLQHALRLAGVDKEINL